MIEVTNQYNALNGTVKEYFTFFIVDENGQRCTSCFHVWQKFPYDCEYIHYSKADSQALELPSSWKLATRSCNERSVAFDCKASDECEAEV